MKNVIICKSTKEADEVAVHYELGRVGNNGSVSFIPVSCAAITLKNSYDLKDTTFWLPKNLNLKKFGRTTLQQIRKAETYLKENGMEYKQYEN